MTSSWWRRRRRHPLAVFWLLLVPTTIVLLRAHAELDAVHESAFGGRRAGRVLLTASDDAIPAAAADAPESDGAAPSTAHDDDEDNDSDGDAALLSGLSELSEVAVGIIGALGAFSFLWCVLAARKWCKRRAELKGLASFLRDPTYNQIERHEALA